MLTESDCSEPNLVIFARTHKYLYVHECTYTHTHTHTALFIDLLVERSRGAGALLGLHILDVHHFRLLDDVNPKKYQPREGAIKELELLRED